MYGHDRIAFVYDCLPTFAKTMAPYQEEILGYFDNGHYRVAVRGPHGLGKTAIASILVHHGVLTAETDAKVATTASAWRQLEKYLWPEIKKSAKFLEWSEIGRGIYTREELLTMSIKLNQGIVEAFAVASDDHTTIEGAHATRMFYVFDEAKTIPGPTWDAAEGAFSNEGLTISEYERGTPVTGLENNLYNSNSPNGESSIGNDSRNAVGAENKSSSAVYARASVEGIQKSGSNSVANKSKSVLQNPPLVVPHGQGIASTRTPASTLPATMSPPRVSDMIEDHRQSQVISTASTIYEALALAISTPGDPTGRFFDIHMHKPGYEDWHTRHVTLEESIAAGRISRKWAEQRARQWGEESAVYQNRVLGEFADNSEDGIIPRSWVLQANERWQAKHRAGTLDDDSPRILGVDVARGGEDKTVIAVRNGAAVSKIHIYSKLATTSVTGHVKSLASGRNIHIETDGGLGAAVYDMLREQGITGLRPITVSGSTFFRDKSKELTFINVRAAMWWHMRELLDPHYGSDICLPPLEELTADLTTPRWEIMKDARVKLESKDEISKRLGRSTDYGDAVCLAFWNSSTGGGVVF